MVWAAPTLVPTAGYHRGVLETGRGLLRVSRAALATLLVLGLASSAHTLGGGHAPGPLAGTVLALVVGPLAWWCTRRRLSAVRLLALLGGAQVLVHAALTAMAPGTGTGSALHVHGGLPAGLGGSAGALEAGHAAGPGMLLAHVVATVVTALLLARAEEVLWRVVLRLLPRRARTPRVPARVRTAPRPEVVVLGGRPLRPLGGRAPPVVLA